MERYKNLGGDSVVFAYEIGHDYIKVEFTSGSRYLYNYGSSGAQHIEKMKELAIAGEGLYSYITRYVLKDYALKLT